MANNYKKVMTTITTTGDSAVIYTVPSVTTTLVKTAWVYNNSCLGILLLFGFQRHWSARGGGYVEDQQQRTASERLSGDHGDFIMIDNKEKTCYKERLCL